MIVPPAAVLAAFGADPTRVHRMPGGQERAWPPYFRPVGFALAVAVGDAVRWEGVPLSFVDAWHDVDDWYQLLARALVYRIATAGVRQMEGTMSLSSADHAMASEPVISLVLDRLSPT